MSDLEHDKGTVYSDFKKSLLKKAKKKYISNSLAIALAEIPNTPLKKSYWNTYHCSNIIVVEDNKMTTSYCKNRWCLTCQSIRIATLIGKYESAIAELEDPYFVTLTAPNVEGWDLINEIKRFAKCWRKITDAGRRRLDFKGIRKSECTARPNNEYHYHYHIIIQGRDNAKWLVSKWLDLNRDVGAEWSAQDLRPLNKKKLIEMFKYFTKLTAYDTAKKVRYSQDPKALDVIFVSMRKTRIFQSFGGFKSINEEAFDIKGMQTDLADAVFAWYSHDWYKLDPISGYPVQNKYGESIGLSGYRPTTELNDFWNIKQ